MNNPLVSIITPSFNQAQFIEETILSVLNQTYKNIEYFVMDGASTDGSQEIIKKYEGRIKYWQSQKDNGQADAINQAFNMCNGEIVAFLNSDDLLTPTAVENIVGCFEVNSKMVMVYGSCSTIDEFGEEISPPKGKKIKYHQLLHTGMLPVVFQPACFFRKKAIRRTYFLDDTLNYTFDYELLLYTLRRGLSIFINNHVACYRVHKDAKSQNIKAAFIEKLKVQKRYIKGINLSWLIRRLKAALMR